MATYRKPLSLVLTIFTNDAIPVYCRQLYAYTIGLGRSFLTARKHIATAGQATTAVGLQQLPRVFAMRSIGRSRLDDVSTICWLHALDLDYLMTYFYAPISTIVSDGVL